MLGMSSFFSFLIAFLLFLSLVTAQLAKPSSWQTLSGSAPLVVAKGGFSGIFPDSSSAAYELAMMSSKTDTILWCDVRLTKDGFGICLPDIKLDNCTNIAYVFPNGKNKYIINGVLTKGWFSVDYALKDLANVGLVQAIYSRTEKFDLAYGIFGVEDVVALKPPGLWLNIQHDAFYSQHLLNMTRYILSVSKNVTVNYVSSPEVDFLRNLVREFRGTKTKLVFRFLEYDDTEPTMNQKYSSLLKNLTFIKTFASGILVPKEYIWNATNEPYLLPHTSVVTDAHKVGLEVFASGFHNDAIIPFNYTYDPLAEYLNYVDNGDFSVDGVLTDHPITSSEAIDCYSHMDKNNNSDLGKPTIISYNGASSDYPDCTDLAYNQAVLDGADFIDCPVQMTKDGVPICMSSIDLIQVTTVTTSAFRARISTLPELQAATGIFVFNFTWEEIHNLKPVISSPEINYGMVRNPRFKYSGQFMKLLDFLAFAKDKALSGVTIKINNAAFLVEKLGFDVVNEVINALNSTGYNNLSTQQVMIQSNSSSVLMKFKQQTKYNLSYVVHESISNADNSSIADIANFAHSVAIDKKSIFLENYNYIIDQTQVVKRLKSAGLAVYVYVLQNEFVTHFWDFFMDPYVEINSYVNISGVDGIITDSPRTTKTYRRNTCAKSGGFPNYMEALGVGTLWTLIPPVVLPPAVAPFPVLDAADVLESPLPSVKGAKTGPSTSPSPPTAPAPSSSNVHLNSVALISLSVIMMKLTLW
ncbi:glycerophosphodiester phosphodiesterase GDPDL4-like isoform X2 [Dioscorea cayenensis subsp. rotundata]|uniref:glycerophosphodiester phosphodiesterase n=1 Tax=Dioscorea cayennensis subsp. rotundata TaxID=55577 RepID=A0AB40BV89_DIOCR|nr:glycerophosphodiester phosphodiesterase GDPDL4-like isoform X2 [Dioscorea cayenensis subsp. rotundata]